MAAEGTKAANAPARTPEPSLDPADLNGHSPTGAGSPARLAGAHRGHASESYFVVGEGLLDRERGRARAAVAALAAADAPASRPRQRRWRRRSGSRAWGRRAGGCRARCACARRAAMTAGGGGGGPDPGGLHVPRAVHRPRPHVRPDGGDARQRRRAGRPAPGPLARASTSTPSTAPAPATPSRRGSTRPTAASCAWARRRAVGSGRLAAQNGFDLPRSRLEQARHDPRPAQRREPRRRPDPSGLHPLPQPRRRRAALGAGRAALRARPPRWSSSTTSG